MISLTGARLGPGNTCGVRVNVVGTSTATNVSGALTSSLGTSGTAGATLTVDSARPGFSKAFAPNSIPLGATSTLTFTFDNTANTVAIGKLEFRDILPAGMVIAPLPNASTDCASGTISSTVESGANAVSFVAFGSLGAGSTCTASIDVTTAGNGSFENVSGELDIAGFGAPPVLAGFATAALEVPVDLLGKSFLDDPVAPGGTTTLRFSIRNPSRAGAATNIAFTDPLPAGLAFNSLASDDCGGILDTATPSLLKYSGGGLAAGGSCTFTVMLDIPPGAASGTHTNTTTAITATIDGQGIIGNTATDLLTIRAIPTLTKSFMTNPVGAGGTTPLRFTITNTSSTSSLAGIAFEDVFDQVLPTASVVPANPVCNGGTAFFVPLFDGGNGSENIPAKFMVTGANLGVSESCTIDATLDVADTAAEGTYPNATSTISGVLGGNEPVEGFPASDDLVVVGGPRLIKEFTDDPTQPGGTVTLEFTLAHSEFAGAPATDISFTDALATVMTGLAASALPANDFCGIGSSLTGSEGDTLLTFAGGTLEPGATCTFFAILSVPADAAPGGHANTTDTVTATVGGITVTGNTASDDLDIVGLTLSKSFTDDPAVPGGTVMLRFTIGNQTASSNATGINFTDSLGDTLSGLTATGGLTEACDPDGPGGNPGTGTLSGTSILIFSGGELGPGESCAFEVAIDVPAGAPPGQYVNTTSVLASSIGNFDPAVDVLVVESSAAGLQLTKSFTDDPVSPGDGVTLEFTIANTGATPAAGIAFTDDLDAVLFGLAATGLPAADVCGAGSAISGTDVLSLTGGVLAAGASCTFDVPLTVPAGASPGTYVNTTSMLTATVQGVIGTSDPATDELKVANSAGASFTKGFSVDQVLPGDEVTLQFTISHAGGSALAELRFTDDLESALPGLVATGLPATDVCGAGSKISGTSVLAFSGGSLAAVASCAFSVTLQVPPDASLDDHENVTSELTANGLTVGGPATDTLRMEKAFLVPLLIYLLNN